MNTTYLYVAIGAGGLALLFAYWKTLWINKQDPGTDKMKEIGAAVREGAMAFLSREYRVLSIFVIANLSKIMLHTSIKLDISLFLPHLNTTHCILFLQDD